MQSRPVYESAADRAREQALISKVEMAWSVKAAKLKNALKLDYALMRAGKVVAFAEVKVRTYSWVQIEAMGGYMLSLDKWAHARLLCGNLPFSLIVEAAGDIRACTERNFDGLPIVVGGRKDRGDWQDMEPCVLIPVYRFSAVRAASAA